MRKKVKKMGRPVGSKNKNNMSELVDKIRQSLAEKALDGRTPVAERLAILNKLESKS